MCKVALVMADNPFAPNGAAGYMDRLFKKKAYFQTLEVGLLDLCHGQVNFTNAQMHQESIGGRIKRGAKQILGNTKPGTMMALKRSAYFRARHAVEMFACLEDAPEAVIFNDVWTHDVFIQQHPDYTGAKIQIMHNNGEFGKMLLEAYPHVDRKWLASLEAKIIESSDKIVFVGKKNRERFIEIHPEASEKAVHVHLGIEPLEDIDEPREVNHNDVFTFVSVGTVCTRKNQRVLLEIARSKEIIKPIRFIVVGGGPDLPFCEKLVEKYSLSDCVEFVGPSNDVASYLSQADAFISTSYDEGLPTVALEAMSCSLPLVLTDVGGCSELIKGNGVLVSGCSPADIVAGINTFLDSFSRGEISGEASLELFQKHYRTESMCDEYAGLIKGLIEPHRQPNT